ncbi:hypothetical protein HK405_009154, partial [Cladochytrium tenue]
KVATQLGEGDDEGGGDGEERNEGDREGGDEEDEEDDDVGSERCEGRPTTRRRTPVPVSRRLSELTSEASTSGSSEYFFRGYVRNSAEFADVFPTFDSSLTSLPRADSPVAAPSEPQSRRVSSLRGQLMQRRSRRLIPSRLSGNDGGDGLDASEEGAPADGGASSESSKSTLPRWSLGTQPRRPSGIIRTAHASLSKNGSSLGRSGLYGVGSIDSDNDDASGLGIKTAPASSPPVVADKVSAFDALLEIPSLDSLGAFVKLWDLVMIATVAFQDLAWLTKPFSATFSAVFFADTAVRAATLESGDSRPPLMLTVLYNMLGVSFWADLATAAPIAAVASDRLPPPAGRVLLLSHLARLYRLPQLLRAMQTRSLREGAAAAKGLADGRDNGGPSGGSLRDVAKQRTERWRRWRWIRRTERDCLLPKRLLQQLVQLVRPAALRIGPLSRNMEAVLASSAVLLAFVHVVACLLFVMVSKDREPENWDDRVLSARFARDLGSAPGVRWWASYALALWSAIANVMPITALFDPSGTWIRLVASVIVLAGKIVSAAMEGSVTGLFSSDSHSSEALFLRRMDEVDEYLRSKATPYAIRDAAIGALHVKYGGRFFDEERILAGLNPSLRQEVVLQDCEYIIDAVEFLGGTIGPEHARRSDFLRKLSVWLRPAAFRRGEVIYLAGDRGADRMFLVVAGVAAVVIGAKVAGLVGAGQHFGGAAVLGARERDETIVAATMLRCVEFSAKGLAVLSRDFPEVGAASEDVRSRPRNEPPAGNEGGETGEYGAPPATPRRQKGGPPRAG